jgi:peptide/nickel transport system substrate-binding protein
LNLNILVNAENPERLKIASSLSENLKSLGVTSNVQSMAFSEYMSKIDSGDYDMFVGGYNLSAAPDLSFAFGYTNTTDNIFHYHDATMNTLLSNAFSALGNTAYQKAMAALQQRISEELPVVSLVFRKSAMLTSSQVLGDKTPVMNNIYANINQWFIAK